MIWTPLGETPIKLSVVALGDRKTANRSSPRGNNNMGDIVNEGYTGMEWETIDMFFYPTCIVGIIDRI